MQLICIYICSMKSLTPSGSLDKVGITASIACAIHCAALPVIITTLPLFGLEFLASIWFEIGMISLSLIIGTYALLRSYPTHKKALPIVVLVSGFLCIGTGHLLIESLESILIPIGGIVIAAAHLINWRHTKICLH